MKQEPLAKPCNQRFSEPRGVRRGSPNKKTTRAKPKPLEESPPAQQTLEAWLSLLRCLWFFLPNVTQAGSSSQGSLDFPCVSHCRKHLLVPNRTFPFAGLRYLQIGNWDLDNSATVLAAGFNPCQSPWDTAILSLQPVAWVTL